MRGRFQRAALSLLAALLLCVGARAADYEGYIVRLDGETALFSEETRLPEGISVVYASENLYLVQDEELVEELEDAGLLVYAEPNYVLTLEDPTLSESTGTGTEDVNWYLDMVGASYAGEQGLTGSGVVVGLVDSGLYQEHEAFRNVELLEGRNYYAKEEGKAYYKTSEGEVVLREGQLTEEDLKNTSDYYGHGTFVAAITAAVAPGATLVPLKCFDGESGTGTIASVVAAILGGVDMGCDILNLSLTVNNNTTYQTLTDAISYAAERGVLLVAAAGNLSGVRSTGNDPLCYPAAYDQVIGVGAVDSAKAVTSFSYQNSSVLLVAPGEGLTGPAITGTSATRTWKGTSFSAPMVTGALALALEEDRSLTRDKAWTLTQDEAASLLAATAEDLGETGRDNAYGCGLLRIDSFLKAMRERWKVESSETSVQLTTRREEVTAGETVMAAVAYYDEDGRLLHMGLVPVTADENGLLHLTADLDQAASRMQLMLLNGTCLPLGRQWTG